MSTKGEEMLKDLITWILKLLFQLIFWVFVLSIRVNDRTLYDHSYDILIDNELVQSVDEKVEDLWYTFTSSVKDTFFKNYEKKKDQTF